jgi:hypothetical protein
VTACPREGLTNDNGTCVSCKDPKCRNCSTNVSICSICIESSYHLILNDGQCVCRKGDWRNATSKCWAMNEFGFD